MPLIYFNIKSQIKWTMHSRVYESWLSGVRGMNMLMDGLRNIYSTIIAKSFFTTSECCNHHHSINPVSFLAGDSAPRVCYYSSNKIRRQVSISVQRLSTKVRNPKVYFFGLSAVLYMFYYKGKTNAFYLSPLYLAIYELFVLISILAWFWLLIVLKYISLRLCTWTIHMFWNISSSVAHTVSFIT